MGFVFRLRRLLASAARPTDSETSSDSNIHPATSRESFPRADPHRLSRLDVHQLDLPLSAPSQEMPRSELRSVVTAKRLRLSSFRHHSFQHPRHAAAAHAGVHFQRQTFPRIRIDHAQRPELPPAPGRVVHEVQRPFLVRPVQRRSRHALTPQIAYALSAESSSPLRGRRDKSSCDSHALQSDPKQSAIAGSPSAVSPSPRPPAARATLHRCDDFDNDNSIPPSPSARRPAAGSPGNGPKASVLVSDGLRAPPVFFNHRFQHVLVQAEIGDQLLQPLVFIFELPQPLGFAHAHPAVLRFPGHMQCNFSYWFGLPSSP